MEARKLDAILGFPSPSSHIYSLIKFLIDLQAIFSLHPHSDAWVQVWYDSFLLVWLQLSPLGPLSLQFHPLMCSLYFHQGGQSLNHKAYHVSPLLSHCWGSPHPLAWHTRPFQALPSSLASSLTPPTSHPTCQPHLNVFSVLNHKLCVAHLKCWLWEFLPGGPSMDQVPL